MNKLTCRLPEKNAIPRDIIRLVLGDQSMLVQKEKGGIVGDFTPLRALNQFTNEFRNTYARHL